MLRSQSLFIYKDKREALFGGSVIGGAADDEQPISIRGCLVDIAYSETKRKHALRLTTQDFCEYLLQAEDREDMLEWIKVIGENSKTDNEVSGPSFTCQAPCQTPGSTFRNLTQMCFFLAGVWQFQTATHQQKIG